MSLAFRTSRCRYSCRASTKKPRSQRSWPTSAPRFPTLSIYVYDNNSTDKTTEVALAAGAEVRREYRRGKGNVVRRMFQDIEADVYVMVDGDDTYDASWPHARRSLDRGEPRHGGRPPRRDAPGGVSRGSPPRQRASHRLVRWLFGANIVDMLSGYRVFSRRFVKSFPSFSREFEIETELTVHAMQMRMAVAEVDTNYKERPPGSDEQAAQFRGRLAESFSRPTNLMRKRAPAVVLLARRLRRRARGG
jgi:glycosyltransferase involved in cell wall biosynthesis